MRLALRELQRAAPAPVDVVPLPAGAPFGKVELNVEGCTLCLACVSACPTGALGDDPEKPTLRFSEDACVQCGLCKATCPEKVITLTPQLDFRAATASGARAQAGRAVPLHPLRQAVRHQEHDRARDRQARRQALDVPGQRRSALDVLKMCEDCRVIAATEADFDPYGAPPRPAVRTTEDYLREREERERMERN